MDAVDRMVAMLADHTPKKRIAAAVVLGELGVRSRAVLDGLSNLARDESPQVAEAALEALAKIGAPKFAAVLESLRDQPWESVSKAALSLRQTAREAPARDRRSMARQAAAFLKKLRPEEETALRGTIKILGYLELPETADLIGRYLSAKQPPLVRVEAITALRFSSAAGKTLRALVALLDDGDALVARAARDTLTVVPGLSAADLFALAEKGGELSRWAIDRLQAVGASKELARLLPAEPAAKALATLPDSAGVLVDALATARDEATAHALSQALENARLKPKEVAKLRAAGAASLKKGVAVGRRQLDPVRRADPQGWAQTIRSAAKKSEHLAELLVRSGLATGADRYAYASMLLQRSSLTRQSDPALEELEKLAASGFALADAIDGDKLLSDEARYHAAFHLAEHAAQEVQAQGVALLEAIAARGRGKIHRAARNKLALLDR